MSTSLYWRLIPEEPKEHSIGYLKYVLAQRIWGEDGSCGQSPARVGADLIDFLEGIVAAADEDTAKNAQNLINAIQKYGEVELLIHS